MKSLVVWRSVAWSGEGCVELGESRKERQKDGEIKGHARNSVSL